MAQTVKITPATGLLEFIGDNVANKPVLQHDNAGNLTLTLQSAKKFTVGGNLKVNGKVTMAQQTLVDGAAITWDFNSGANAKVTIAGARTLVISNMETGDTGLILVKQDAVGGRTLTLPNGSSIVGGGSYTASTAANATDVLGVYYDGTTYWWTIGYNTVTPPLTSVGITGSDFTISNSPLTSNGNIGLALATVNSNVGQFGSASAVPVITVNAKGLITAVSTTAISIPTDLNSLTDVTLSSSTSGQLLQFNGSQWVNWTPNYLTGITSAQVTTALGYTPVTDARTITINGVTYDLTTNRTWTISTVDYVSRVQHGVKAGVAINKGQAVYVTSGDGTNMIVGLASNTSEATSSKTMGLLDATVAINGMANVITEGLLAGLDTSLAGAEGDPVWLGTNGNLIFGLANKPYAPNHLVFIGIVTRKQQNNGEIFVKVQNGFELKEIHDVDLITTVPVNGHILGYNGTLWVNKTIAGWLGFTPANDANVVHTSGNETIAGIKTFSGTTQATSTTTGTIVTAGGAGIAKNLYVGGDLNVVGNLVIGGTTTTVNAQNLTVSDNMIYLNNGIATTITNVVGNGSSVVYTTQETHNYVIGMSVTITGVSPSAYNLSNQTITGVSANSFTIANSATGSYSSGGTARAKSNANPDLGWAAGYNDGSYAHAGLFRDATDGTFKFFKGYTPEPDASPFIDTSHASFALADLQAYNITGNTFVKAGGTSSQFLKADGSVDSSTYLTTGTASSTYQPLDADLTAIAALATTGFLKRTGTNTWSLDSNTYLTSYTETDTLATVTGRGATTSTGVTFSGGARISNLLLNSASSYTEGSLALGAMGTGEGGQLVLNKATSYTYAAHLDIWQDVFRVLYGTNAASAGVALSLNLATQQLILPAYTTSSSFSGTATGYLAFDASGNIITVAVPTGAVSSVNAGTGVSVNSTTGAVTVSIGQSVATTATPTFDYVITTNNGNGTNVKIGDDVWLGDVNNANTLGIKGQQDATAGYITFGSELSNKLGRVGTGDLTWGGNRIWHAGNLTNLNQLTNGPGYITGINSAEVITALGYTPVTNARTLTINGTPYDLTANRTWNVGTVTSIGGTGTVSGLTLSGTVTGSGNLTLGGTLTLTSANVTTALGYTPLSSYTETDTLASVTGRGATTSTAVTFNSNVTLGNSADLVFTDLAGTFPTSGKGFDWTLNNDGARIYAVQPSSDSIDLVFQLRDNATTNDRFVFWVDDYQGPAFDKYPLIIRGGTEVDLVDSGLFVRGTQVLTNARVLQNISGNISMFTNDSAYITNAALSSYATQAYVTTQISNLVASAPAALDTLNELAAALGNDANFSTTISTALGNRLRVDINTQGLTSTQKGYGRTNLGVVIGTDVQAWDADLDAIAALAGTSGYLKKTAANTWSLDTNTYITGNQTITLSGDVTGSGTTSISTTLSNTGVTASTYKSVTVDAKGRVTAGSNPTTISGFGITDAITTANIGSQSVAYATDAKWISFDDGPRDLSDRRPNWNNRSVAWDFVGAGNANGVGNYAGVMTFSPWDGTAASTGDSSYQLAFINETGVNASGVPGLRLRNGIDTTWNNWYQVWHSGNFTNNSSNWNTAYSKRPTAIAFSGTSTKTLTLTLGDSSTLTATFSDIDTNTDAQTLSLSGSTLSISGGNSITLPTSGISQSTADSLYVNVTGDTMTGNLYVSPTSNPAQIQLAGTNPELYVHASTGTARMFINRQASSNQATLMFTTGMNVTPGTAWDYTGVPMWSMGMTNNNNTDSFKVAYGDIYDANSVALEITSANVAYFRNVPYGGGSLLATQAWVSSQGYITGVTNISGYSNNLISQDIRTLSPSSHSAYRLNFGFTSWNNNNTSPWADYLHLRSYSDASGGLDNLVMFKKTGGIGMRIWQQTWGSATAYSSYVDVIHSGNIGSYAWTSSNDGAGSGLDADLLDGYNTSAAGTANTIALRDSSGNLYGNYILGTYFNASQGNSENPTIGQIWTQNTSDNYLRKSTPAHFRSQITDGYYLSLSGGTVSGNVNLTGELAFIDGNSGYSNIIRSAGYPSEGYPTGSNYWLEYRSWGGHHFVLNTDGGAGSPLFAADDFVIWQGAIDGDRLLELSNTGTLTIADRLIELSSIRYKTSIESLTPALDKVLQLRPVYYTKIGGTGSTEIGLIAEEVAEIYPELIKYNETGQVDGINYTRIAPILIKTIQEQQELIKNLTKRIDDLENR